MGVEGDGVTNWGQMEKTGSYMTITLKNPVITTVTVTADG